MGIQHGIFSNDFCFEERFIDDEQKLQEKVNRLKAEGLSVVLTMGSFDMLHIGHCRYLREAKKLGHVLVVGVETDEKVRSRKKGTHRPVVPQEERYEMLAHTRYVDILTPKSKESPKWHLIKLLRPDVLQAVEGTYTAEELIELQPYCGKVVVQARQAETSTSAKIRKLVIIGMKTFNENLLRVLPDAIVAYLHEQTDKMREDMSQMIPALLADALKKAEEKEG